MRDSDSVVVSVGFGDFDCDGFGERDSFEETPEETIRLMVNE